MKKEKEDDSYLRLSPLLWGMKAPIYVPGGAEVVELEDIPMTGKRHMLHLSSRNRIQFHFSP